MQTRKSWIRMWHTAFPRFVPRIPNSKDNTHTRSAYLTRCADQPHHVQYCVSPHPRHCRTSSRLCSPEIHTVHRALLIQYCVSKCLTVPSPSLPTAEIPRILFADQVINFVFSHVKVPVRSNLEPSPAPKRNAIPRSSEPRAPVEITSQRGMIGFLKNCKWASPIPKGLRQYRFWGQMR